MSEAAMTHAAPPDAADQADDPVFHAFRIGTLDCTALSDGYVQAPFRGLAPQVPEEELRRFLVSQGDETDGRRTPISCLFVRPRQGPGLLVDAGIGRLRGPAGLPILTAGRLAASLAASGVDPGSVETVLVSHLHPDHVGGLFDEEDRPVFPRARYHVSQEEIAFWSQPDPDLSGTLMPPAMQQDAIRDAKRVLALAGGRIAPFPAGAQVMAGVTSLRLEGHTAGQVGFIFDGGAESLLYTADAAPHRSISFLQPDWRFSFDADPAAAIATRKRLVELVLEKDWTLFTPHFPWPSVGKLMRRDGDLRWVAAG